MCSLGLFPLVLQLTVILVIGKSAISIDICFPLVGSRSFPPPAFLSFV